jgi:hypothetical protein
MIAISKYYVRFQDDWSFMTHAGNFAEPRGICFSHALTRDKHLYVLGTPDGHYKIGIAKDVDERRRNLQCGSPHPIGIQSKSLISPQGVYAADLEREVHALLAHANVSGEWFKENWFVIDRAIKEAWVKLYCPPLYMRWRRFRLFCGTRNRRLKRITTPPRPKARRRASMTANDVQLELSLVA